VHGAGALERLGNESLAVAFRRQVGGDRDRPLQLVGEALEPVETAGGDDHGGTHCVKDPGEALTETRRRAGDDGDPAVEPEQRERIDGGVDRPGVASSRVGHVGSMSEAAES
jgi:hypothetical protein